MAMETSIVSPPVTTISPRPRRIVNPSVFVDDKATLHGVHLNLVCGAMTQEPIHWRYLQGGAPVRERVQLVYNKYNLTFGLMNGGYIELVFMGIRNPRSHNWRGAPPCTIDKAYFSMVYGWGFTSEVMACFRPGTTTATSLELILGMTPLIALQGWWTTPTFIVFVAYIPVTHRIRMYTIYGNIYHQYIPNVSI